MDPAILEELYANLSLDGEVPPAVEVDDGLLVEEVIRLGNCLVGKVLSPRPVDREAFRSNMARL